MRTWLLVAVIALLATSGSAIRTAARQATPTSAPRVSDSSQRRPDCPVPQMGPANLVVILREAAPEDPDAMDPRGDAVPPADRAMIGDLLATWQLCLASGDIPGVLGLFTDDGIRRLLGERSPFLGGPAGLRVTIVSISPPSRAGGTGWRGRHGRAKSRCPSAGAAAPPHRTRPRSAGPRSRTDRANARG